jgi:YbgC/YbaW family acyl-CoA thioester hydrolase
MSLPYTHQRVAQFHETDMAGIVHFSNFFRWMEAAEHAFLDSLGLEVIGIQEETFRGWPRVRASAKYHAPVRFNDHVQVLLSIKELKPRAIVYAFEIRALRDPFWEKAATGSLTTVYVEKTTPQGQMRSIDIPEAFKTALKAE